MKLNYDCIRDIMLYIEENQKYTVQNGKKKFQKMAWWSIKADPKISKHYSEDDIEYSIVQLFEVGYIVGNRNPPTGAVINVCYINDITPAGHEFLDSVKNDTVWNEVKRRAAKVGGGTLKILIEIAKDVFLHYITGE